MISMLPFPVYVFSSTSDLFEWMILQGDKFLNCFSNETANRTQNHIQVEDHVDNNSDWMNNMTIDPKTRKKKCGVFILSQNQG